MIWLLKNTIKFLKGLVKKLDLAYWKYIRNPNIMKLSCGPGYKDQDYKILYANFDIFMTLMDEYAVHHCWTVERDEKRKISTREFKKRKDEFTLAYLNWGATLDLPSNPDHQHMTDLEYTQRTAEVYKTKMELYLWWTKTRPRREDPIDKYDGSPNSVSIYGAAEDSHYAEDTRMLKKLMDIRGSLWI